MHFYAYIYMFNRYALYCCCNFANFSNMGFIKAFHSILFYSKCALGYEVVSSGGKFSLCYNKTTLRLVVEKRSAGWGSGSATYEV